MDNMDLAHRLRILRRTVLMLQTELRRDHLDEALIAEIDAQMERGIATEPRCTQLPGAVDAMRESAMNLRVELFPDTIRACEKLKDAIEVVMSRIT